MGAQVNTLPSTSDQTPASATAGHAPVGVSVSGDLRRRRAGWIHLVQLLTGLALLRWLLRGVVTLVGYRHPVTLSLQRSTLRIEGQRMLMGLSLGPTEVVVPLSRVRWLGLSGQSPVWALVAAAGGLLLCGGIGLVLGIWGVSAGQVSWLALGVSLVALGAVLDAAAYLWLRRASRKGKARLALSHDGFNLQLVGADLALSRRLVKDATPGLGTTR